MKIHLSATGIPFVALVCIAVGSLAGFPAPAFAQEGGAISGSIEEKNEPEPKPDTEPNTGPVKDEESGGFRVPPFGIGLNLGITTALITVEGSGLLFNGGGLEIGGMVGLYPLIFGEGGVEAMRFDLTTETDREANQRVRVELFGYYIGGGVGLPFGGGGIGFRYRIQRKSLVKLQVENRDTGETDLFRDRITRRSYFLFLAFGGRDGKSGGKKGNWFELGVRYDDVDKNIFLISDVLGAYFRALIVF